MFHIFAQISNLKSALERKDAELEQLKSGNARAFVENQKPRTVSPFRVLRHHGTNGGTKPESCQRPLDDAKTLEVGMTTFCVFMLIYKFGH